MMPCDKLFNLREEDRMQGTKILAMFDEFPFLHRYVENPLRLHSVKVSRVDEALLLQQAKGKSRDDPFFHPNQGASACQTVSFFFLDQKGNEIGQARPSTWLENIELRKILEAISPFRLPGFRPSDTLLEVLRRDQKTLKHVHYIVEVLAEKYLAKAVTVHKKPQQQSLSQTIEEQRAQHRQKIGEV